MTENGTMEEIETVMVDDIFDCKSFRHSIQFPNVGTETIT